jgi:hypothetical protein
MAVVSRKDAILKGLKEFGRLVILGIPALAIQVVSGDPTLTLQYGTPILFVLRALDKYIHENPAINAKGILPF